MLADFSACHAYHQDHDATDTTGPAPAPRSQGVVGFELATRTRNGRPVQAVAGATRQRAVRRAIAHEPGQAALPHKGNSGNEASKKAANPDQARIVESTIASAFGWQVRQTSKARRSLRSLESFKKEDMRHFYFAGDTTSELGLHCQAPSRCASKMALGAGPDTRSISGRPPCSGCCPLAPGLPLTVQ